MHLSIRRRTLYGGFSYWLEGSGPDIRLITESWCRVGGSGRRHEITPNKVVLLEEGFVRGGGNGAASRED